MRTKTVSIYRFNELSDKAKQRAKDAYAENVGYTGADEALDSLGKLAEHFNGKLKNYSIDWFGGTYSSAKFEMPELAPSDEWVAQRLADLGTFNPETLRGHGDCVLTGVGTDEDAIDGFRIAYHAGERDLNKLMQAAFKEWLKIAQSDCEAQYTDENFGEHCEANGYEFDENGNLECA